MRTQAAPAGGGRGILPGGRDGRTGKREHKTPPLLRHWKKRWRI